MDELIRLFFEPLTRGYLSKYMHLFKNLEHDAAVGYGIAGCWAKIANFDRNFGTGYNYFTKIVYRHLLQVDKKEDKHKSHYINESSIGNDDDL